MTAPSFTVVVPTRDRPARLAACLEALVGLDYPAGRYEVVVVDDGGSADLTPALPDGPGAPEMRVIRQENTGPGQARNRGAREAQGELLAFTDDDCVPTPGWLRAFACHLREDPDLLLGGHTVNALTDNPYSAASQLLVDYLYDYFNGPCPPDRARFFTSNNLALSAASFRRIGGFDAIFHRAAGEDRDFVARWHWKGWPARHVPEAVVRHSHAMGFAAFLRQHFNYGRGALHFRTREAQRYSDGVKMEPLGFYLGMMRRALAEGGDGRRRRAWGQAALLGVTQAANAAGFVWERLTEGPREGVPLPAVRDEQSV